ncbi:MAG: methylenetetrahydrofolate reductase [NAD(P)H] [Muribaculaceae bacterium]|nr:methylenetetrahydrofolate reductase [NAD(P)H] [Muribaculaceae bacterium]
MTIPEIISSRPAPGFSIEVLPPLKGRGIAGLFAGIDSVMEFGPSYVNITTHRSELIYKSTPDGLYQRVSERARPGTVAVAAAIQQRYGIPAVPHLICSGFSKIETEYALIDLNFLGITNLLLLRGDKAKHESRFTPVDGGHAHASELQAQVNDFNRGMFLDGTMMDIMGDTPPFSYGVAGYPEKHDEAPNPELDMMWLKHKVDCGASYIVTQMFFDNARYFDFVDRCRKAGIDVPIIPGVKPVVTRGQLTVLPKVFHVDIPSDLARELMACKDDDAAKDVGVEWCTSQLRELYAAGVPSVHIYSLNATKSVKRILKNIYG